MAHPKKSYCGAAACLGRRACRDCRNISSRATRKSHGELTAAQRRKANCRSYTKVLQARGILPKGPCEGCGSEQAQNHHPNYDKPRWFYRFCVDCHAYASDGI